MDRNGDKAKEDGVLHNNERLVTQHNLWTQRQEFKEQLTLFEMRINEQYEEVAHNFTLVNQDMSLLREATDNLNDQVAANDANMEQRIDSLERAINNLAPTQGKETIIDFTDHMIAMKTHAPSRGEESFIAMLVPMNALHKKKHYIMTALNMIAMPTMGVTTNPTTTSSTTWNRHLIVSHMLMLKTKVIKLNRGVISEIIHVNNNMEEETRRWLKRRSPTMDIVNILHNLVKTFDNTVVAHQVKLVFISNTNPMLWLAVEDLLTHLKPQEMKASALADGTWKMKRTYYANTWWEQVVTLREEKGEDPIDTWEEMKEEMQARFVPVHYKTDLFNKLQKLKQDTKTVEEFYKEMELTMMRANIQESENQTIARFFNGLNYPIKRIVEFQPYSNMVELVHQASKAERQVKEDIKYSKSKSYFASKLATTDPTTSAKPSVSSTPSKQTTIQTRMKQPVTSTASSKASTGPSNVTCFKCGTQGHKSFECKNTKVMITMENGDIETLSEGEYEALVQAAVANEEDYDEESGEDPLLCVHDTSPSLVVTRVLTTQPQAIEDQQCNIFQTRAGIGGKSIKVIIDGGSCHNLASTEMCDKINLTLHKHPHPYHVQWLSNKGNVKIQHTVTINFKIGPYEDTVECDVVPMTVCHMLLGHPWQYDNKAIHDGHSNVYTFKAKDKKFELRPMTSSQIITDNAKEFQDVFPDELPYGLPPLRGIEHRIDLTPGAPLPNRAAYRTNPEDTKEIQCQIQDPLAKGLSTLLRTLVKKNLKSWEECLPHAEFAYNRAKHSTTSRSPFMIVYGFEPPTALDNLPLPLHERTNMDFDKRTTAMKKLHEDTRATIQEHVLHQATRLNAKKNEMIFEEGDLVWIHLRKETFRHERNSKLKPRGDGPFKVLKHINNNAYIIDIPTSKYLVSNTFNMSDLSPYHGDEEEQELMACNSHVRWEPQEEGMMRTAASFPSERNQGLSNQEEPRSTLKVDGGKM
ncbi:hypothetical protein QYE76_011813 [Lolium multiflorum]|uniref:CCHC-type domain-containing protein n=1 Tax=Lolium multiflorum TaxID=4521 RepID=A0AAD8X3C1_LOLMU|nr:hypothetical protein QYE76_011813 [Lolium multiflorum]